MGALRYFCLVILLGYFNITFAHDNISTNNFNIPSLASNAGSMNTKTMKALNYLNHTQTWATLKMEEPCQLHIYDRHGTNAGYENLSDLLLSSLAQAKVETFQLGMRRYSLDVAFKDGTHISYATNQAYKMQGVMDAWSYLGNECHAKKYSFD